MTVDAGPPERGGEKLVYSCVRENERMGETESERELMRGAVRVRRIAH